MLRDDPRHVPPNIPHQRVSYTPGHVRTLVEEYQALRPKVNTTPRGLNILVQLADLDTVLARIPDSYWEVVLLHGLLGLPTRHVAEALKVHHSTISRRYENALAEITYQINQGGQ